MKQLIKNAEDRIVLYKKLLEEVNNKIAFVPTDDFVVWYKSFLREQKNMEERWLKDLIEEKTFENQGLNPPFFYHYL